jgi:predicted HicB family RNase H-like nuclease
MMEYKGYIGRVEFDDEAGIFHGDVINTRDVITFQGESVSELKQAFQDSVDDYLSFCAERGEQPDKPFSGQFVTRIPPELHRKVNVAASLAGKSLNAWVADTLQSAVASVVSSANRKSARKTGGRQTVDRKRVSRGWLPPPRRTSHSPDFFPIAANLFFRRPSIWLPARGDVVSGG